MKINKIDVDRNYNGSDKTDGDALYYLICALDKCNGKSHKDLDFSEKMQVLNRLDATISKLNQIKNDIEKD